LWPYLDANQTKKLDLVINYDIIGFFYVFNNKHWFKYAMLFCINWRDDKWLSKKNLPISYLYVETKWKPYMFNDELTIFDKVVSIIMNFNLIQIHK
jgi:hypothetical protein